MNVTPLSCTAEFPFAEKHDFKALYIVTEIVIAILAIIGNLLVCLAVIHNKKLRTVTNYFLVSLAMADILVGLVAVPCAVLTDLGRPQHNLPLCQMLVIFMILLTQSSILSMFAVAVERYVAILLPFQYQRVMSTKNAGLALLLTWVLAAITGSVPLMDPQRRPVNSNYCIFTCVVDMNYLVYFNIFCCFLLPLVAMFIIYGHIFLTVRHQIRRIAVARATREDKTASGTASTEIEETETSAAGGSRGGSMGKGKGSGRLGRCKAEIRAGDKAESGISYPIETETPAVFSKLRLKIASGRPSSSTRAPADHRPRESTKSKSNLCTLKEVRKATSLFLVFFLFMVCWMPISLTNCVLLFCPRCDVPISVTLAAILLSHANSALNPILYAYSMRSFRHTLIRMWKGVWSIKMTAERR